MAQETLKEKTAKGLFWGGVSNGLMQLLSLLFGIFLSRILNAEDYGLVGLLAIFTGIAGTLQESGFSAALTNKLNIRHDDYNSVFWFNIVTGSVLYIILFFLAPLIALFLNSPNCCGFLELFF